MADDKFDPDVKSSKKGGLSAKIIVVGIPLFVLQLVGVYWIVNHIVQQKLGITAGVTEQLDNQASEGELKEDSLQIAGEDTASIGPSFLHSVSDILMNPAGTNGQAMMLVDVSFSVGSKEQAETLTSQDVLLRDMIGNTMAKKTLDELRIELRDSLRHELTRNVQKLFPKIKIKNVYFSKFIIQ